MPSTLIQSPRPSTVMEWRYSLFVEPMYNLARSTGIFDALVSGYTTVEQIAEKTSVSQRGVRCVLRCLVAAGVLTLRDGHYQQVAELPNSFKQVASALYELRDSIEKGIFTKVTTEGVLPEAPQGLVTLGIAERQGEQLVLTEPGRCYFTPGQELYLGTYILHSLDTVKFLLPRLEQAVRTGQRVGVNDPKFFTSVVDVLFLMNYTVAQQLADYLATKDGITTALDLGSGSGVWSIPLARKNPNVRITAFDSALVLEKTRAYTERYGVSDRYHYQPIDFPVEEDWGKDPYDLIYLCYFCDGFMPEDNRRLVFHCARYLRRGGYLVMVDFLPKEDWSGPLLDVLFSIQMLCFTNSEGPYTQQAYEDWCRDAGLTIERVLLPGTVTPALVACKAGS